MFRLKELIQEGEVPKLYTDPAYSRTNHWELSTSNLSSSWLVTVKVRLLEFHAVLVSPN